MVDTHAALADLLAELERLDEGELRPDLIAELEASGDLTLLPGIRAGLDRAIDAGDLYGRAVLFGLLADLDGARSFETLLRAMIRMRFHDVDSQDGALYDLMLRDPDGCRPVALAFARDGDRVVRQAGLWALGCLARAEDFELLAAIVADADPELRAQAAWVLGTIDDDDRVVPVLAALADDGDAQVRASVAETLGRRAQRLKGKEF